MRSHNWGVGHKCPVGADTLTVAAEVQEHASLNEKESAAAQTNVNGAPHYHQNRELKNEKHHKMNGSMNATEMKTET